jgi:hypothetical protein
MAAPDPPSTPGLPVPAPVAPANAAPVSPETRTSPYPGCGVKIPVLV